MVRSNTASLAIVEDLIAERKESLRRFERVAASLAELRESAKSDISKYLSSITIDTETLVRAVEARTERDVLLLHGVIEAHERAVAGLDQTLEATIESIGLGLEPPSPN